MGTIIGKTQKVKIALAAAKVAKRSDIEKRKKSIRTLYLDDKNFSELQRLYPNKTSSVIDLLVEEFLQHAKTKKG